MNDTPQWWYVVSGLFFGFGILFYIVLIGLLLAILKMVTNLTTQVKQLVTKVDAVAVKVDGLVTEVRDVTKRVGVQATGAASTINLLTRGIAQKVEVAQLAFLVLGAVRGFLAGRKTAR